MYQITILPNEQILSAEPGSNLLEVLRTANLAPDAPCGGNGTCGKCRVIIDGEELILTTGEDGRSESPELPCQMFFLEEVEAPAGYYLKGEVTIVNVVADTVEGVKTFYIANEKAGELPETGGIGTTAFYILGAVLVLGAGVILVSRRRMNNWE